MAVILLTAQFALATPAAAWWNSDWTYRMKVEIDPGKPPALTGALGRAQILVRLHQGNFNFDEAKEDGSDLRFVGPDDKTPLAFDLERFDGLVDQVALAWVNLPDLPTSGPSFFYVYWGNKAATAGADAHATYDADASLVYHFAGDSGPPHDSTAYGNTALTPTHRDPSGLIGGGLRLDGRSVVQLPASPSLRVEAGGALTVSFWLKAPDAAASGLVYDQSDAAGSLRIGLDHGLPTLDTRVGGAAPAHAAATVPLSPTWHFIALTASDHVGLSVDGAPVAQVAGGLPAFAGSATIGGAAFPPASPPAAAAVPGTTATPPPLVAPPVAAAPPPGLVGGLDEFRISKVARPAAALALAVKTEGPDANLLSFDAEEQASVFGTGYVGIIFRSITPDALAIICVLGVMSAISWWVMIGKGIFLGRLGRANRAFRREFERSTRGRSNAAAFSAIKDGALRHSSLYRLYQIGTRELNERLDGGRLDRNGMLAPQSIAAIRASLDGGMVRESQRLNRLMVMLTIAIAGGPFIGLLGTVVGVMITFAAIAAAGDVNVNAIAPGISAALLATVAGLFVAIPALFGYNYFLTRIRDASGDMATFVDELVTRMGEGLYRDGLSHPLAETISADTLGE